MPLISCRCAGMEGMVIGSDGNERIAVMIAVMMVMMMMMVAMAMRG